MHSEASIPVPGHSGGKTSVWRLLSAIGYPDTSPGDSEPFTLQVDGGEIIASESTGRLRLSCRLTSDEALFPRLAAYAAGRLLKERAALACDADGAFLWQEAASASGPHDLKRFFEAFASSCDWWRARLEGAKTAETGDPVPEMTIRP